MGFVTAAADAVVALLSLTMAVAAPLFDAQVVLPRGLYPAPLVGIHRWFAAEFGHYLVADPPPFFRGLVWLDLAFLWPVCVANLYGILARRPWSAATSIMAGVYVLTYMSAIFGEMLGSGRTTPKLIQLYVPFALAAFCVVSAHAQHRLLLLHLMPQLLGRKGSRSDAIRWERQPSVMVLAPNCLLVTLKMVGPYMRANKVISRFKLSFYLFFFQIDVL
uniref:EXPERA domain-containing protein n=1 Tax=Oryza nivara TaxID=4536 RepID=A0A0E0H062_ORYNI